MNMEESSSMCFVSSSDDSLIIQTLEKRGWCFGNPGHIQAVITLQRALVDDVDDTVAIANAVESELLNTDLREFGSNSLPDPSVLRKSSYILGPKVLQISSVRDISRSNIDEVSKSSNNRRMLKLGLTDGQNEIIAIEYSRVPSLPDNIVPGTKVCLESKTAVYSGIVCLNPSVVRVIGGVVQSLYEEWQMNKKYSGFSRESLQSSQHSDLAGPPPFEKLEIRTSSSHFTKQEYVQSTSKNKTKQGISEETSKSFNGQKSVELKPDIEDTVRASSTAGKAEGKQSISGTRPKEVVESVPIQNQVAAQKLLQKKSQSNERNQYNRGRKYKGKAKQEETPVFTLDEWEKRNASVKPLKEEFPDTSHDEDLAVKLQNQLDLEDSHQVDRGPPESEAERILRSMFNYERDDGREHRAGNRGWGRGKGRGRGRGQGIWRAKGRSG